MDGTKSERQPYTYVCADCEHYRLSKERSAVCKKFNMYIPQHVYENAKKECRDFEDLIPF